MRSVEASRGFEWWKSGFETVFKAPAVFLVMGLAWGIPLFIPFLNLIPSFLNPALQAGVQQATRKLDAGQMPEIGDLFSGLQTRPGPLIVLCLLPIVFMILILILAFILGGSAILAAIAAASGSGQMNPAALMGLMGSMGIVFLIAIPLSLALFAAMFFAVSRVMFDNVGVMDALKESFAASMKNIGAMLVFIACAIVIFIGGALLSIIPVIGGIVFVTLFYPVIAVASYRAYLDVFQPAVSMAGSSHMQAPPPPPGAPGW